MEQTVAILRGLRERYERHHGVMISDAALDAAAVLSDRYVRDRFLPDKAIDLIDRAAARVRLRARTAGPAVGLEERFEQLTRARDVAVDAEDYERAEALTRELDAVAAQLATARERCAGRRGHGPSSPATTWPPPSPAPRASRWPGWTRSGRRTGSGCWASRRCWPGASSGRTRRWRRSRTPCGPGGPGWPRRAGRRGRCCSSARPGWGRRSWRARWRSAVARSEPVRFDMGEFADASASRGCSGRRPGTCGHDEPGQLTEALRRDPYAVLLFDEVEKAHREVTGAAAPLLDEGRLTDAHGRSVDATHTVVV